MTKGLARERHGMLLERMGMDDVTRIVTTTTPSSSEVGAATTSGSVELRGHRTDGPPEGAP